MMRVHKTLRSESGASAVELALLLPVLMLILFGIIEFGLALHRQAILTNASREGARVGIVQSIPAITTAQMQTVIDNYLTQAGIPPANVTPDFTCPPGVAFPPPATPVCVKLTLPYAPITSFIAPINLVAQTVMRHE